MQDLKFSIGLPMKEHGNNTYESGMMNWKKYQWQKQKRRWQWRSQFLSTTTIWWQIDVFFIAPSLQWLPFIFFSVAVLRPVSRAGYGEWHFLRNSIAWSNRHGNWHWIWFLFDFGYYVITRTFAVVSASVHTYTSSKKMSSFLALLCAWQFKT